MRILTLTLVLAVGPMALAQGKPPAAAAKPDPAAVANPISFTMGKSYDRVKKMLLATAELMPAENYAFKPTPEVRSFGQILGHVTDSAMFFCGTAKKEPPAKKDKDSAEKLTTKADVEKALKDAFAYCDKVYADSTDATLGTVMVPMFGTQLPKFAALDINVAHMNEHYGNLVTYLRLKKLTPPSSMPEK
jgi:uncharacterized damage-inducible protein DinB